MSGPGDWQDYEPGNNITQAEPKRKIAVIGHRPFPNATNGHKGDHDREDDDPGSRIGHLRSTQIPAGRDATAGLATPEALEPRQRTSMRIIAQIPPTIT